MPDERKEKLVQSYLDGKLSLEDKHDFKQQLKKDHELKQLLESYSMLFSDVKDLVDPEMPVDLWKRKIKPAMTAYMDEKHISSLSPMVSFFTWKKLRPFVAVAAMLVVTISVTLFLQNQLTSENLTPSQVALANIEINRLDYVAQLSVLEGDMQNRKTNYDPAIWEIYEDTVTKMNEAIAAAELVYSVYSDDQDAIEVLFAAYDDKAEVIRKFMDLEM